VADLRTGGLRRPGIHTVGPFGPRAIMLSAHSGLKPSCCRPVGPEEPVADLRTGGLRRPGIHTVGPFGPKAIMLSAHSGLEPSCCRPGRA
jgi:hypothetical protein